MSGVEVIPEKPKPNQKQLDTLVTRIEAGDKEALEKAIATFDLTEEQIELLNNSYDKFIEQNV
jgi:uncharacterized protein YsxB (DUF464 family)